MDQQRPTRDDIERVARFINAGSWIDPSEYPDGSMWECALYDGEGKQIQTGEAFSRGDCLVWAYLNAWYPDAIDTGIDLEELPPEIPAGWTFHVLPPGSPEPEWA